jgi:transposase InsO family protein
MLIKSVPSVRFELIHETTARDNNLLCIEELCRIAGVSRSGYYYWQQAKKKRMEADAQDERDFELILIAYKHRGYDKGARGIHMRLLRQEPPVVMNPKKVRRLMKKFRLRCPIRRINPYRRMAKANQEAKIVPNLLNRRFRTGGARRVLLSDITYIPRRKRTSDGDDKYSYLAVIMDAFTKEILAWVISMTCETDFILDMLEQLMENHGTELKTDALIHNDQGCQYTSSKFTRLLEDNGLRQSMSRRGNCWDNAPQESFFGHMKDSIRMNASDDHNDICRKVSDWMEYYNNERPQWNLDKLTPHEYYSYVTTGVYPQPIKPESVINREKLLTDGKTVEELIIEEENELYRKKAEKAKLKNKAKNGIRVIVEEQESQEGTS